MKITFLVAPLLFVMLAGVDFSFLSKMGMYLPADIAEISFRKLLMVISLLFLFVNYNALKYLFDLVNSLYVFLLFILVVTLLSLFHVYYENIGVPFSVKYRVIVQIVGLIGEVSMGLMLAYMVRQCSDKAYYYAVAGVVIAMIGVVWQIGYSSYPRLAGIHGEPKFLALYILPFVFSFVSDVRYGRYRYMMAGVLLVVMLGTYSATAFLAFFVAILVAFYLYSITVSRLIAVSLLFVFFLIVIVGNSELYDMLVGRIISYSQTDVNLGVQAIVDIPFFGSVAVEGNDAPSLRFVIDEPLSLIFGVGVGLDTVYSYEYLKAYESGFLSADYNGYITSNLALVNNLLNYGLVILIPMTISVVRSLRYLRKFMNPNQMFLLNVFAVHYFVSLLMFEIAFPVMLNYVFITALSSLVKRDGMVSSSGLVEGRDETYSLN